MGGSDTSGAWALVPEDKAAGRLPVVQRPDKQIDGPQCTHNGRIQTAGGST